MLGLRLSPEIEQRFARFVRASGRAKSDVARAAITEYLDRHSLDEEFERQLREAAAREAVDPAFHAGMDELEGAAWETIQEA